VTRLFEQFQPEHYNLELDLQRDVMHFNGTVVTAAKKSGRPSQRLSFPPERLENHKASITNTIKKA